MDEQNDDGIDAFYYDRKEHVCYLAQSKWSNNGTTCIDVGSVLKFIQGVHHLLENKLDKLGPKMRLKDRDIQDALEDSQATFVLVIAYTGISQPSAEVNTPLQDMLSALNDDGQLVSIQVLRQKELHNIVEQSAFGESVDLTIMLHAYGVVREPFKAYYGQVNASDIIPWEKYGDRLYHKNIRGFKGSTDVNNAIAMTLRDAPDNFLYFNNGITLLCSKLEKKPLGGKTTDSGVFECKGASVVNGAQTVGSIISGLSTTPPLTTTNAKVMVRLISLEGCPKDFGFDVTRATNTQNKIEKRDFASLDKEQMRLKSDLFLSFEKEYVFRSGDHPPTHDKGCTLEDATVALACANPDITYCMTAKREISRLYEDVQRPPYTAIFNPSLTAQKLWRAVEVLRRIDTLLKQAQQEREGKDRLIAVHGNRLLLHVVFQHLNPTMFDAEAAAAEEEMERIPQIATDILEALTAEVTKNHASAYPGSLFKNITKCKNIAEAVTKEYTLNKAGGMRV